MNCWLIGYCYHWIGGIGKKCPSCNNKITWIFDEVFGVHHGICGSFCRFIHIT